MLTAFNTSCSFTSNPPLKKKEQALANLSFFWRREGDSPTSVAPIRVALCLGSLSLTQKIIQIFCLVLNADRIQHKLFVHFESPFEKKGAGSGEPLLFLAERGGFEPPKRFKTFTRFPSVRLQPLGHLSSNTQNKQKNTTLQQCYKLLIT